MRVQRYFLSLDGVAGDVSGGAHANWFDVSSLGFQSKVDTAGHLVFSGFEVGLTTDAALIALLSRLSTGTALAGATLHGVDEASSTVVMAVNLANVLVSNVTDSAGRGLALTLGFDAIEVNTLASDIRSALETADPALGRDLRSNQPNAGSAVSNLGETTPPATEGALSTVQRSGSC